MATKEKTRARLGIASTHNNKRLLKFASAI
jgi:hypothetical protein